ncbi:TetR/AcrR family transcriptional regulator [uncultured Erythrobacter sp.]|uniref:TetR/AcrR family transcriptional regulator n=1 Tax=uncultured Erythrobacter sp. TaxID=263913 RepID=UPI0026096680|nr:TetR/AcrR family transcriptional regulator [uncultured Erythrobacter sp.]
MDIAALPTKGERTRAHIVATAAQLFWRRNFHGVSVDQVAEAAEVNKATVYRYFADKRDLALAVVKFNGVVTLEVFFAATFDKYSAPQDRLAEIYRLAYAAHAAVHADTGDVFGCPMVGLALELGQDMPEIREEAERVFTQVEEFLIRIARDALAARGVDGDPQALGRTLMQLQHGAFASSRLSSNPTRMLDAGHAALTLIGFPDTPILEEEHPDP